MKFWKNLYYSSKTAENYSKLLSFSTLSLFFLDFSLWQLLRKISLEGLKFKSKIARLFENNLSVNIFHRANLQMCIFISAEKSNLQRTIGPSDDPQTIYIKIQKLNLIYHLIAMITYSLIILTNRSDIWISKRR